MSVEQYVHGKKDVLVATDIASKGLDFPNIQHVINYDMPDDIENYGQLPLSVYIAAWCADDTASKVIQQTYITVSVTDSNPLHSQ